MNDDVGYSFSLSLSPFDQLRFVGLCESGIRVRALCRYADELVGFDDVSRQGVTVNTTRIQADCLRSTPWFRCRPMSEEHRLITVVNVIPGRSFLALAVGPQNTDTSQVASRLRMELNIRPQACMNHQMLLQIDYEWQSVQEAQVFVFFPIQFIVRSLMSLFEFYILAVPVTTKNEIMISYDRRKSLISHKKIEYLADFGPFGGEVADRYDTIRLLELDLLQ